MLNKQIKSRFALAKICVIFALLFHAGFANADRNRFIVAIDVGHSEKRPGAISSRGIGEFFFNRNISRKLLSRLKENGFVQAFIINPEGKNISLSHRPRVAKQKKADIFVSIHHDSVQPHYLSYWKHDEQKRHYSDVFSGHSLFISSQNKYRQQSLLLAIEIGDAFNKHGFSYSAHHAEKIKGENRQLLDDERGIYDFGQLVVLKKSQMPAVLIECGIIVNREQEALLSTPDYQDWLVDAIFQGIENYFLTYL